MNYNKTKKILLFHFTQKTEKDKNKNAFFTLYFYIIVRQML